jgi:hypothetical protein
MAAARRADPTPAGSRASRIAQHSRSAATSTGARPRELRALLRCWRAELRRRVAAARRDFAEERVLLVERFWVAETDARLCALLAERA